MGYNPLPETKEDLAEKMARENRLTGKDLYKALPDLYAEELRKLPPTEELLLLTPVQEEKKLEADIPKTLEKEEIKKLKEEKDKALEQYREEAKLEEPSPFDTPSAVLMTPPPSSPILREAEEVEEENITNVPRERPKSAKEKLETQKQKISEQQKKYVAHINSMDDLRKLIENYKLNERGTITKNEARVIFNDLTTLINKYIIPTEYDRYINEIKKDYNRIMSEVKNIRKPIFKAFLNNAMHNLYYKDLLK